jgi:hypothetical protein
MMTHSELMQEGKRVVFQANSLAHAMVVRSVLEGAGIATGLNYETIDLNEAQRQDLSGGVDVTVAQPDSDQACELLYSRPAAGELFWVSPDVR